MGIGGFPGTHPLSLGMLGMHGTYYANMTIHNSDLIVAIGARFDDRVTGKVEGFAPDAKIIHIDVDPTSIRKNVRVDIPIVGDVKHVMVDLNKELHHIKNPGKRSARAGSSRSRLGAKNGRSRTNMPMTSSNPNSSSRSSTRSPAATRSS
jgi:acetolactate synthase-1/2/3 large subunit